ncbi:PREDICTED: GATA zinc finger domain-containing protein 14-like [Rhagoletis zephyria]|uniref:GATA zinc finger domain-containing protein 14-like n=1 Tax=Rhagoletis zephyria TaxID=28612 RepID=UPI0008115614|nr:PREDICTED: GATA zinc finger domain-containing protein 14-like [Rhagoletis zephyria]
MEQEDTCRPVPAPRRLYPELRKLDYENVTVELINKNLNINSENLHTVTNCTEKVPNNKIFFGSHSDLDDTASTRKSILTETNDLYGPNANETVATPGPIYSTPTPAPRPRKPQNTDVENDNNIYENTEVLHASPQTTPTLYPELPNSTRAISKENSPNTSTSSSPSGSRAALRKAPLLPPKTYLSAERERSNRAQRYSIGSEVSTTSSYNVTIGGGGAHAGVGGLDDCAFGIGYTQKSASNATLNSSVDESNDSGDNSKFKSPSPGYVRSNAGGNPNLNSYALNDGSDISVRDDEDDDVDIQFESDDSSRNNNNNNSNKFTCISANSKMNEKCAFIALTANVPTSAIACNQTKDK